MKDKEFNLSDKIESESEEGVKFNEEYILVKNIKEAVRRLKEIKADDLANWYKEHEKYLETLSSMEICNENHNCNEFVIKKLNKEIDKIFGDKLI